MAAHDTVGHVVAALADSLATALECYAGWRQRQQSRNHYQTRETAGGATTTTCAAGASLAFSKLKVEEAFDSGAEVLGEQFVTGDAACRGVLLENLWRLRDCVEGLETAAQAENHPLPLAELVCVSEAVRVSCLEALHKQYQRVVVGRLVPRVASPSSAPALSPPVESPDVEGVCVEVEVEVEVEAEVEGTQAVAEHNPTSPEASSSNTSNNNCEPPSPPLTPTQVSKEQPGHDGHSIYSQSPAGFDPGPTNSVFKVFCPEAMKYQVDLEKALPVEGTRCGCGYDWRADSGAEDRAAMVIKDGFQITPRFLGKSHCEEGLGCVLCTSSGKTETFNSIEGLKTHINSSHTKWQLLHDRDLTGR